MEFDEDRRGESRFWDHIFSQAGFVKDGIVHVLIGTRERVSFLRGRD